MNKYRLVQNAGRCDVCGKPIDMSSGDQLTIMEFGGDPEINEQYDLTDQDMADSVADALEAVAESGADYDLAATIRNQHAFKAHETCLGEQTQMEKLLVEPP